MENFKLRLTKSRESRGLNKSQLAKLSEVTPHAISMLESGQRKPGYYVLIKLANTLGVTCDYLMGRDAGSPVVPILRKLNQSDKDLVISIISRLVGDKSS